MSDEHPVKLYVYDLTNGMARAFSPMLLGEVVEGVWHTSVVVHNHEFFFGYGVQDASPPGSTPFGQPLKQLDLGTTQLPLDIIKDLVADLGQSKFRPEDYNLIQNNCNHFSEALASLVTKDHKDYIIKQHEVLLRSPMGAMLTPILMQMEGQMGAATAQGFAGASSASQPNQQPH